ncbi:MAG: cation:proton antiporter, partial [Puniceicoccales bacterium]
MELSVAASLLLIFAIGAVAQWIGWRLKIPAILLLLTAGFLAGPVFGVLDPDEVFVGDLLFTIVSGAVAIILFEGGLSLRFHELPGAGPVIMRLISVGVLVSWVVISLLAYFLLDFSPLLAALLGALLTVTGPTVIGPMLRTIRPKGKVRNIAKWEGIIIDPIGVLLAVLIYEVIIARGQEEATSVLIYGIIETLLVSVGITAICAGLVLFMVKKRQLPDFLQNTIVLALLLVGFGASNYLREESGLLTATLFGIVLANQSIFEVRHITEFKENLQILLISFLFVVLAARVDPEAFRTLGWVSGVFLVGVIVLARPLAVLASTLFSKLKWDERILLMLLAPRGIVAVALTSVFVIKLDKLGIPEAEEFLALTLLVVIGTVLFYGVSAGIAATKLGLSNLDPQGVIMVGAHDWGIRIGVALKEANVP